MLILIICKHSNYDFLFIPPNRIFLGITKAYESMCCNQLVVGNQAENRGNPENKTLQMFLTNLGGPIAKLYETSNLCIF